MIGLCFSVSRFWISKYFFRQLRIGISELRISLSGLDSADLALGLELLCLLFNRGVILPPLLISLPLLLLTLRFKLSLLLGRLLLGRPALRRQTFQSVPVALEL